MQIKAPKRGEKGKETEISVGTMSGFVLTEQATCVVVCDPGDVIQLQEWGDGLESVIAVLTAFTFLVN